MAKKNTESEKKKIDIFKTLQKVDNTIEILETSTLSKIDDWIPTGNYILNACLSGDLFKGVPSSRVLTIYGPSQTGKSYLAVSICREAQKKGYTPIYLDSEAAMDKDFVSRLGCDPNNFIIKQVNTIREASTFIANMCHEIQEAVDNGAEKPKIMLVLDSLGNLASEKEKSDAISGSTAQDFTKAKDTRALFRVNTIPVAKLQIPWVVINHAIANIGSFTGGTSMTNGSGIQYAGSITLNLSSIAKLDDKENNKAADKVIGAANVKKSGVLVTAWPDKSRFCIPHKVKFQIPYYKKPSPYVGLEDYLNWENAGIMQGKCLNEDEYNKLKPNEQLECIQFDFNGENRYAWPKKTMTKGVGIVCKHLGRQVTLQEFYSPVCFTDEYLHYINDNIIRPLFSLPDQNSFDDIAELEKDLGIDENDSEESNVQEENKDLISTEMPL